jgi:hypothetical protein
MIPNPMYAKEQLIPIPVCNYERCAHLFVKIFATTCKCLPLCKLERVTNAHAHSVGGGLFGGAVPNLWEPYVAAQALNFSHKPIALAKSDSE